MIQDVGNIELCELVETEHKTQCTVCLSYNAAHQSEEARKVHIVTTRSDTHEDSESISSDEESVAGEPVEHSQIAEVPVDMPPVRDTVIRAAMRLMDEVNPRALFEQRAAVMKGVRGPFRNALKLALHEATRSRDEVDQERGWKLFFMLPRMLLHKAPGSGSVSRNKLLERFDIFARGEWIQLVAASEACDDRSAIARRRRGRRQSQQDDIENRVARAETLVQMGELSSARQALEGASVAPGTNATLSALKDESKRPSRLREPLPREVVAHVPAHPFDMDEMMFLRCLRSARRGAAAGPSGMTTEHLRPLLDDWHSMEVLFKAAETFSRGLIPESVVQIVKMGRMTALSKPDGGVRGIVAGDVFRRLVARTMAQQLAKAVLSATSPHPYALSTRAGCECVAHALQGLTELDPRATVTSIDRVSAFDSISRRAMMTGLLQVEGGSSALPLVRMFYGAPSEYLWEDSRGTVHRIPQGEGGEQGDALMPLLFAVGQHNALEAVSAQLWPEERLIAFLDDIYLVTSTVRVGAVYAIAEEQLRLRAQIRIHGGRTKVWNRSGQRPPICDVLERIARIQNPQAVVWRGSNIPTELQGIKVLGTPLGHADFVSRHLRTVTEEQRCLLDRIPMLHDVQSAWLLLLHCAAARANYQIRSVHPDAVAGYAQTHDENLWQCLCCILRIDPGQSSLSLLGELGGLPSDDFGASPRSGNPVDRATGGTPRHSQLESSKRFRSAVAGSRGFRATFVEGIGGRCKARVPPPRCFRERRWQARLATRSCVKNRRRVPRNAVFQDGRQFCGSHSIGGSGAG